MFEVLRNAWRVKDLRRKLLYTIMMLLLFRLCTYIPTPFIDQSAIKQAVGANSGWGVIDIITGGSLSGYTFMAMGITPYINASIILQLLTVVIPRLEQLSKEGPEGRKKITQYTRYLGIILAFVQAVGICMSFGSSAIVSTFRDNLFLVYVIIGLTLTAGSALAIWMGERITENGIGNGISMLIFIGIIARLPSTVIAYVQQAAAQAREGNAALWWILPVIILAVAALVLVTHVILSVSRSALIALILYAFCFTVLLVRNRCGSMKQLKRLGVSVLAGVCAVVVCWGCTEGIWAGMQHMAVGTVIEEPDAIERSQEGDVSNNRFEIWRDYISLAGEIGPAGLSLSNYNDYIGDQHPEMYIVRYFTDQFKDTVKTDLVYESHNNYLFVFISTGFVGAGLFLCFLVLVLVRVIRYILRHPQLSLWTITTLAVVAFGLVEALFMNSVFLKINDVSFIFWLALGALMLETEDKVPAAERTL